MKKRTVVLIMAAILLLAVCIGQGFAEGQDTPPAIPADNAAPQSNVPSAEYKYHAEDVMKIIIWGEPNLSTEQMVDPKGYINMPLLGQIYAEGLTQNELVDKLKESLTKYLVEPKIQISMIQFQKNRVYVLGQVYRPGVYEFKTGERVMEAIAQAGSYTEMAYLEGATLTHKGSNTPIPLDLHKLFYNNDMSQNLTLMDGDTINILEDTKNKYYVLGEVVRPSMYKLKENINVVDAISIAGGPTERGAIKGTCIIRGAGQKDAQRIIVNMDKLLKSGDLSQNIILQAGDVVYVPETSKPDWQKISSIVSSIVNTSYLFRIW